MSKRKTRFLNFKTNPSKLCIVSKIVIIVLVFGLIMNHINIAVFVNAFEKPIETIISDQSITKISEIDKGEIVDKKTKYSKTYKLDNGLCEIEFYNKAVHYLDNGKYYNIDNTLIASVKGFQNKNNSYKVTFPYNLFDNKIELNYLNHSLNIYYDSLDSVGTLDKNLNREIENLHDSISYKIDDNVYIRYDVLNESIKENIILNSYIPSYSYSYFIETDLSLMEENDKLYFYNDSELVYLFDSYLMYDKDLSVSYDIITNIEYISDNTYKIIVTPSNDYLENANYPVTIDPEIHLVDGGLIDGIVTLYEVDKLNNTSIFKSIGSFNVNNRTDNILTDDLVANFNIYIPRIYNSNISMHTYIGG